MTRLFQPADVWQLRTVGDPRLAPDGRWLALTVTWPDGARDAYATSVEVLPVDGGRTSRISDRSSSHSPRWSPDGGRLAYLSRGEHADVLHIHEMAVGAEQSIELPGRAGNPSWSPDGRRIVLTLQSDPARRSAREQHAPMVIEARHYRDDGLGYRPQRQQLAIVDTRSSTVELITEADFIADEATWSPDGRQIAFVADRRPGWQDRHGCADLWVRDLATGAERVLTAGTGHAAQPAFSPDGAMIAFLGYEATPSYDRHQLLLVARADGTQPVRRVAPALDRSVGAQLPGGQQFTWLADSRSLLFLRAERGCVGIVQADFAAPGITRELVTDDRQVDGFDASGRGDVVVFTSQWPSCPSEAYRHTGTGTSRLTAYHDQLPWRRSLAQLHRIAWTGGAGTQLTGFSVRPPERRSGPRLPLVVDLHGGPHGFHPYPAGVWHVQSLAAAGFAMLLPNPRGSGGDTEEFKQLVTRHWGDRNLEDVLPLVDATVGEGSADPARLYLFGTSYGGYLTAYATTRTTQFAAAAVGAGMVNLVSALGTSDIPDYFRHEIGDPERDGAEFRARSPLAAAGGVRTPTLLMHWEGDWRCPVTQAEEWFTALHRHGVPVRFVRYPGGSHSSRTPSQLVDRIEQVIGWFGEWPG